MATAPIVEPDTKDWTWVLTRPCGDCGFEAARASVAGVAAAIRSSAETWAAVLRGPGVAMRPVPATWSTLEYACHVRDVHRIFAERVRLMLDADGPTFATWDQDATAVAESYDLQDPAVVGPELTEAAAAVADLYDSVAPGDLGRFGYRSDGSEFTIETLARYHLHDVVHHLWDVRRAVTVATYHEAAEAYRDHPPPMSEQVQTAIDGLVALLPRGSRVLEIGSGAGRDALALEAAGLSVRRTDVTPGFVSLLRESGGDADVLAPLTDDLTDPARPGTPYDAVWASASLLHVARGDLPVVLRRLAQATRPDGLLRMSVKEGDGEGWSTHGTITGPRMFVYWREAPLRAVLDEAGWTVETTQHGDGLRGEHWLVLLARRRAEPGR